MQFLTMQGLFHSIHGYCCNDDRCLHELLHVAPQMLATPKQRQRFSNEAAAPSVHTTHDARRLIQTCEPWWAIARAVQTGASSLQALGATLHKLLVSAWPLLKPCQPQSVQTASTWCTAKAFPHKQQQSSNKQQRRLCQQ